jgi:hypothetical protein
MLTRILCKQASRPFPPALPRFDIAMEPFLQRERLARFKLN